MSNNLEDDDLEWEEWNPTRISFFHHMIAGSAAGLAEHVTVFPIDTLKTHIQCERCGSMSPMQTWNCATRIVGREGIFRLWRGVTATFAGCLPGFCYTLVLRAIDTSLLNHSEGVYKCHHGGLTFYFFSNKLEKTAHAAYFSIFESTKILFGAHREGHHPIQAAACGASAAFGHDLCMTPFDTVKQRMQLGYYSSVLDCVTSIAKKEGIRAFYLSLNTTLMMNVPYGCVMVSANESAKKILNPSGEFKFSSSMLAGSIAGAVAAALTNPLDVIKTRLQTQNLEPCPTPHIAPMITITKVPRASPGVASASSLFLNSLPSTPLTSTHPSIALKGDSMVRMYVTSTINSGISNETLNLEAAAGNIKVTFKSAIQVIRHIIKEEGYVGFLRGLAPRMMLHAPAVAISWTTYETVKSALTAQN